jgi:hypothetical protein
VIAQEAYNAAACGSRFFLERHHQVHHWARLGTAIEEVADLDESCSAGDPVVLLIDQADVAKDRNEVVEVTVHIADCDYCVVGERSWSSQGCQSC